MRRPSEGSWPTRPAALIGLIAVVAVGWLVAHSLAAPRGTQPAAEYTTACSVVRISAHRESDCYAAAISRAGAVGGRRTSGTVVLTWRAPRGAVRTRVSRDGRLVDVLPARARQYVDHERWPGSVQGYRLTFVDRVGRTLAVASRRVRLRSGRPIADRPFSAASFFNRPIPSGAAVDPSSSLLVATSLVPFQATANFGNSALWGIPIAYAQPSSPRHRVRCTQFWCDRRVAPVLIPSSARPSTGSDGHLAVIDASGRSALELWRGERTRDGWAAGVRLISDLRGSGRNCNPPRSCPGAVAAGFSVLAGLARPEEIAAGRIDHALAITVPVVRAGYAACPAVSTDGSALDQGAIPEGARLQLDPSFDVGGSHLPRWQKIVARALQRYGAYVVDFGGTVSIRAQSDLDRGYDAWRRADVPSGPQNAPLRDLPLDRMRVLELSRCAGGWPASR